VVTPEQRRAVVTPLLATYPVSTRPACQLSGLARSRWYHQSERPSDAPLMEALQTKSAARPRWGYRRLHILLARDGRHVTARQVWAMDVIGDQRATCSRFRVFSLVDTSLPAARVVQVVEPLRLVCGVATAIAVDNGPEFIARALDAWAYAHHVQRALIRPGKPIENAYVESCHDRCRGECLDLHWFASVPDARETIAAWQEDYNMVRPHSALGQLTPAEFASTFSQSPQPLAYTS